MSESQARKAGQVLRQRQQQFAEQIVARQYELQRERWRPMGDVGREKSVRDAGYHLSYLAEAVAARDPALFEDYIAWVQVLFDGLGFVPDVLETTLRCTADTLHEQLPPHLAALPAAYVAQALQQLGATPAATTSFLSQAKQHARTELVDLAQSYLDALLRADRRAASQLILGSVEGGLAVREVYLHAFQPVQREVGRLWQLNQISVAQEHYCTAATQMVMSQLYPHIFSARRVGRTLVATCVGRELHELGVRMVADFFEMEGWDTYYLGANVPTESILRAVADRQADVLAVSATMTYHVGHVQALIDHVRSSSIGHDVRILVGGYPFNVSASLWKTVGADGYARDAQQAIAVADGLARGGNAA
ncbi:MAG: B12-binding domain-containing protein [Anaerolineae bacterium]|jgi:methanogenic corrinoid protein MtbC1